MMTSKLINNVRDSKPNFISQLSLKPYEILCKTLSNVRRCIPQIHYWSKAFPRIKIYYWHCRQSVKNHISPSMQALMSSICLSRCIFMTFLSLLIFFLCKRNKKTYEDAHFLWTWPVYPWKVLSNFFRQAVIIN
jgi:hypothetical protein